MKKWYYTFSLAQYKLSDKYICIRADTETLARSYMLRMFGINWRNCYTEEQWVIRKGSKEWDTYVYLGKIPENALYDAITIGQILNLKELKL